MYKIALLAGILTALAIGPAYAEPHGNNHDGSRGVHVVPLRDGNKVVPEAREIRHGQFSRGSHFSEEPYGWVDGDPCWDHMTTDDNRQSWVFICD